MELKESVNIEFKREYADSIKKTVVAFANTAGGKIYVGVDDDSTVVGVSNTDDTMLKITNSLRNSIKPDVMLFVDIHEEKIEDKDVVVINVQKGAGCPYYLSEKGIRPEGVYIRQGTSSVTASDAAILKLIKETDGDSYESIRSICQELTFYEAEKEFKLAGLEFEDAQKKTLRIINGDGLYTNLGLLLSDQCVHTIKIAVFEGLEKEIFKDRYEFSGSLLKQLNDVYSFIDRYNRTSSQFDGLRRKDIREYPVEAIRETLLNTLVHRDYSFSGSTLISIFDDRMEYVSLGGLAKGIELDDIMLGASISRNINLANVFYRLHLIEAYGTGIPKIIKNYAAYNMKPNIETSNNAFKITLFNTNKAVIEDELLTKNEQLVKTLFDKNVFLTRNDIENELDLSQTVVIRVLAQLIDKNLILKIGEGKNTKYQKI